MSDWTLRDISEKVRDIDFAMLLTRTESGEIAGRLMSNNRDVEYDGNSFFFSWSRRIRSPISNATRKSRSPTQEARVCSASHRSSSPFKAKPS